MIDVVREMGCEMGTYNHHNHPTSCRITYLDTEVGGDTQCGEREEHKNSNVDKQVGSAVETLEGLSELTQYVLTGHNDLREGKLYLVRSGKMVDSTSCC